MKVLQVNCVYRKGSTGKIVHDLHKQLQNEGITSVVCYGRGERVREPGVYKTCSELSAKWNNLLSRFTGMMYGGCLIPTWRLIRRIKKEKPDVVHLHCINGYFVNIYRLIAWLKKNRIRTVLTLHAEFMHTGNCGHALECNKWESGCGGCPRVRSEMKSLLFDRTHHAWEKMRRAFEGFPELEVISVSPWLMKRAERSPILKAHKHSVILNGIDVNVFRPVDPQPLRQKHGLEGKRVVFHVTAVFSAAADHIKGGRFVLELAEKMKDENVVFLIAAGNCGSDVTFSENVIFLGNITDQNLLAQYYTLADVTLLTSKKETFSMPVAESLCCGTPVVGFEAGAPEQIALPQYSKFVPYGDKNALIMALEEGFVMKNTEIATIAAKKYAKEIAAQRHMEIYCSR